MRQRQSDSPWERRAEIREFKRLLRTAVLTCFEAQQNKAVNLGLVVLRRKYERSMSNVRSSGVYSWLYQNVHFRRANGTLQKSFRHRRAHSPFMRHADELILVAQFVEWAQFYHFARQRNWRPRTASARTKRAATRHTQALIGTLDEGIELADLREDETLRRLLETLCIQLRASSDRSYGGSKALQRFVLQQFAGSLYGSIGLASAKIVGDFAEMLGLNPDRRTLERYVAAARINALGHSRHSDPALAKGATTLGPRT